MRHFQLIGHTFFIKQSHLIFYVIRWLIICTLIGALAGSASALFLIALNWATEWREAHLWIIALLPVGGFLIGLSYYLWDQSVEKGNNLLIEEFHSPKKVIPLKMAPIVLITTVATHFFGGSAGREGTAVQIGGSIADQFTKWFKLKTRDRKILIIVGISAGFASVFGTPLAGAIFALEVLIIGRIRYEAIFPSFLVAYLANYFCELWPVNHTHYSIPIIPEVNFSNLVWAILAGMAFGLAGRLFSKMIHFFSRHFKNKISYPPLRPVIGGIIIALVVWLMGSTRYIGLGLPVIIEAFHQPVPIYDFLLKTLFTTFTLAAGFKGGEVTPLFFIGATLGNMLFWIIPLPMALLAGMGFVAVFAAATNTPLACILMGIELFGIEGGIFIAIACIVSYLFSGHS
ncbi:voltage-gated chloride channel family protein, partial [Xanthovirga aplysinae]|uniref:voltage-gated chloride channel family protein n=1 Tax=Xanthovirga aplysinae TaxID=2529853 RepID=UPI0012BC89D7